MTLLCRPLSHIRYQLSGETEISEEELYLHDHSGNLSNDRFDYFLNNRQKFGQGSADFVVICAGH